MHVPLAAAYLTTYLVWGATFLGIRIAVETIPPLEMAALRFLLAGALVAAFALGRGPAPADARPMPWPQASVTGGLLFLSTHGIVSSVETSVPSGLAALAMATIPLWMALFGREPMGIRRWFGLAIGLTGVAVLAGPGGLSIPHAALLLVAAMSWAAGSLLTRRWGQGRAVAATIARQSLAGGVLLVVASWGGRETWVIPSGASAGALGFLVVGGIAAYVAYTYLLRNTTADRASSYAYVNPVVAVALGMLVGEPVTWRWFVATPLVVAAVLTTLRAHPPAGKAPRRGRRSRGHGESGEPGSRTAASGAVLVAADRGPRQ